METLFIIACYIFVYLYFYIQKDKYDDTKQLTLSRKNFILFAFCLALFCLSGYLSIIFVGIIFSVLLIEGIKQKTFNYKLYSFFAILVIAFIYLLYPHYMQVGNCEHAKLLEVPLWEYIKAFLNFRVVGHNLMFYLVNFLFYNISFIILLYIINFFGINVLNVENKLSKKEIHISVMLFLIAFIWIFAAYITCPYKDFPSTLRYLAPAFPILGILLILLTYNLKKWLLILVLGLFLYSSCTTTFNKGIVFYNEYNTLNISNLPVVKDKDIPVVVIFNNLNQAWYSLIMYMNNDKKIIFENDIPDKNYKLKEYILITSDTLKVNNYEPLNIYGENIYYIKNK